MNALAFGGGQRFAGLRTTEEDLTRRKRTESQILRKSGSHLFSWKVSRLSVSRHRAIQEICQAFPSRLFARSNYFRFGSQAPIFQCRHGKTGDIRRHAQAANPW